MLMPAVTSPNAGGNLFQHHPISTPRVRRHRHRRDGLRCVLLDVRDREIKVLIARGYLAENAADDVDAIGRALGHLLDRVMR
jgi:predicted molibdopterin-dependent oxidoreductase YjgC